MVKNSPADKAYEAATKAIGQAIARGGKILTFDSEKYHALDRIPWEVRDTAGLFSLTLDLTAITDLSPLRGMSELVVLNLNQTKVSDLTPLQGMISLEFLSLSQTKVRNLVPLRGLKALKFLELDETEVTDLSPLQDITKLRSLDVSQTNVGDLSPLKNMVDLHTLRVNQTEVHDLRVVENLSALGMYTYSELSFWGTPAAASSPELRKLSNSRYHRKRTRDTIAYLKTLPPYPEPLPWLVDNKSEAPLTVETILTAQTPLGWRFSPTHGAMVVYVQEQPLTAFQSQLADMAKDRARDLLAKLAGANSGLRKDVRDEALRFATILSDDARPLAQRSLELWGSLIALGSQLDAHDLGRAQARDALDMLATDQRASLMTLLQIAGNLVRSFPDVKALDEGAGGFLRREVTLDMVAAMIEAALRAAYVAPNSAALMQHVAGIGKSEGGQAEKATSVSVRGIANLITSATLIAGRRAGVLVTAAAVGAAGFVGKGVAEHYELDQAAVAYFEGIRAQIDPFIDNLPPDEAAQLRAAVNDMEERLADQKSGPQ